MKKITTLIFVFLVTMPFYGQWIQQNSGVTAYLRDVFCISTEVIVVVGYDGTILKSTNGGANWAQKISGTTNNLLKVQFVDANVGYTVGDNGTLLKTVNGGEDWSPIAVEGITYFNDLNCLTEDVFYVTVDSGSIKKTINGGISFEPLSTTSNPGFEKIQFLNEQIGYASRYESICKTMDGGNTWTPIIAEGYNNSFFFLNENIGFVYSNGGIFKTIDGGLNLMTIGYYNSQEIDLFSLNENTLWEVGGFFPLCFCDPYYCVTKRNIVDNTEGEQVYNCNLSGYANPLNAVFFANETTGFVVGYNGAIYKNTTGTMEYMGIDEYDENNRIQVYPNPSSDKMTIDFGENSIQPFSIEIKDYTGKHIFSKSFQASNSATINVAPFAKGTYFLTITSEEKVHTEKVIIN